MPNKIIKIYTDGGCHGNPGPGAWGALVQHEGTEQALTGFDPETTNNRMELLATIKALESLTVSAAVELYTDSKYVKDGITVWIHGWKKRGWKTAANKPVKNQDLWERLDVLNTKFQVGWFWVKGHSGHPENERVDALLQETIINNK